MIKITLLTITIQTSQNLKTNSYDPTTLLNHLPITVRRFESS